MAPRQPSPDGVPLLWGDKPTQMGRGVPLPPAGAAGSALVSVLDARGNDHLPWLVTVFVAVSPGAGAPPNAPLFVQLQAKWGVGGTTQVAIVSARRGTAFTVAATALRLDAQNLAPFETQISAVLAYGARPSRAGDLGPVFEPAPLTLEAGTSADVPVPPFAQSLTLLVDRTPPPPPPPPPPIPRFVDEEGVGRQFDLAPRDPLAPSALDPDLSTAAPLSVELVSDPSGAVLALGRLAFPEARDIPLPSGIGFVRLRAWQSAPVLVCRPVFSLAL